MDVVDETLERGQPPSADQEGPRLRREACGPTLGRDEGGALDLDATRGSQEAPGVPGPRIGGRAVEWVPGEDSHIGRYIVLSRLGEGGMGVVLAAYDPELDRKVALKLLKTPGEASLQARLRLQREAQALAKLDHRNVVSVHDVGVHMGHLFVAMEFVDGVTLDAWMHELERPRPWREVLAVLVPAGSGLAAAHAEGLVHRDFKPDNVMIGGDGRVRVMDFGIARASAEAVGEELLVTDAMERSAVEGALRSPIGRLTRDGSIIGTPAYMSYEQLRGVEVDARSDQFSFCVTLYEALYGELPFSGESLGELMASVKEGSPVEARGGPRVPSWLRQALMRGLNPDPKGRWPSMEALLEVLADDPVSRRRRRLAGAGLVGLLGAGAAAIGVLASPAEEVCAGMEEQLRGVWDGERQGAVERAILATRTAYAPDTWRSIKRRLDDHTGAWVSAREGVCEATRTGEQSTHLLDLRMACLDEHLHYVRATVDELVRVDQASVEDAVRVTAKLPGIEACERAEVLAREPLVPEDPAVAARVAELNRRLISARTKELAGHYEESIALVEEVLARAEELDDEPLLARARHLRGVLYDEEGRLPEAVAVLQRSLESTIALKMIEESAETATELIYVVGYRQAEAAEPWISLAKGLSRAAGSRRARTRYLGQTATVLFSAGEYEEARRLWEQALALLQGPPAAEGLQILPLLGNLGVVARRQGRYTAAREYHMQALEIIEAELGPEHPEMANTLGDLGGLALKEGDLAGARASLERALEVGTRALGPEHPKLATPIANLGLVASAQGRYAEARAFHERVLAMDEEALGPDHPSLAIGLNNLGKVALYEGKFEEARALYTRALTIREKALGPEHPGVLYALANLGELAHELGEGETALRHLRRALGIAEKALEADDPLRAKLSVSLSRALLAADEHEAALGHLERALKVQTSGEIAEVEVAVTRYVLAQALWEVAPDRGRDRRRARSEAELALGAWGDGGDRFAKERGGVQAWLEAHRERDL